jgi:hypothetical protein
VAVDEAVAADAAAGGSRKRRNTRRTGEKQFIPKSKSLSSVVHSIPPVAVKTRWA